MLSCTLCSCCVVLLFFVVACYLVPVFWCNTFLVFCMLVAYVVLNVFLYLLFVGVCYLILEFVDVVNAIAFLMYLSLSLFDCRMSI